MDKKKNVLRFLMLISLLSSACSTHISVDRQEAAIPRKPVRPLIKSNDAGCLQDKDFKQLYLYIKAQDVYINQLLNLLKPIAK